MHLIKTTLNTETKCKKAFSSLYNIRVFLLVKAAQPRFLLSQFYFGFFNEK